MDEKELDERKRRFAATVAFFSEVIRFIVLPLILLYILITNFPLLTAEFSFRRTASTLILFGGLIAFSSSMEAYFPVGSKLKMTFGTLSIITLCGWFWFLFSNEKIIVPYGSLIITLDLFGLLIVILFAISLKGLLPMAQYLMAREKQKHYMGQNESKRAILKTIPPRQTPSAACMNAQNEFEPPPPEDFVVYCPACGSAISPYDDFCPICGVWIRQKL